MQCSVYPDSHAVNESIMLWLLVGLSFISGANYFVRTCFCKMFSNLNKAFTFAILSSVSYLLSTRFFPRVLLRQVETVTVSWHQNYLHSNLEHVCINFYIMFPYCQPILYNVYVLCSPPVMLCILLNMLAEIQKSSVLFRAEWFNKKTSQLSQVTKYFFIFTDLPFYFSGNIHKGN